VANPTSVVGNGTLKQARMCVLEEAPSVNAVVRECLEEYDGRGRAEAARRIVNASRESVSGSKLGRRGWKQDDAYEACGN
jgi:hypothetical protein